MSVRSRAILAAVLGLSFMLTGCDFDALSSSPSVETTEEAPPTQSVKAVPATVNLAGVVESVRSTEFINEYGIRYECAAPLVAVDFTTYQSVNYNATTIVGNSDLHAWTDDDYEPARSYASQSTVWITFDGPPLNAVSAIFTGLDSYYAEDGSSPNLPVDDAVINLTPEMLTADGFYIDTSDITVGGTVSSGTFCVNP